jgi:hypothetical protein
MGAAPRDALDAFLDSMDSGVRVRSDDGDAQEATVVGKLRTELELQRMMAGEEVLSSPPDPYAGDPPTQVISGVPRVAIPPAGVDDLARAFEHVPSAALAAPPLPETDIEIEFDEPEAPRSRASRFFWATTGIAAMIAVAYGTSVALEHFFG